MQHRDLDSLDPRMRTRVDVFLFKLKQAEFPVTVIETLREQDVQDAYYAQGRDTLENINALRKKAGLWPIGIKESKKRVTDSRILVYKGVGHGNGMAIDLCPMAGKIVWWGAPVETWERLGTIGEASLLEWGGRWKTFRDCPHFQYPRKDL